MRIKLSTCRLSSFTSIVLVVCSFVGCAESVDPAEAIASANSTNLQRMANLYLAYQTDHNWVGPPDEVKFKDFIRGLPAQVLTRIGVDSSKLEGVFVSERDGQPFKIRWSVVGNMMGSNEPVVFESVGVDGKRMVGTLGMAQLEVGDAEYESLWAGKGTVAAPGRDN